MEINDLTIQLINNPSFILWVKSSESEEDAYWQLWIKTNPQHQDAVEQARSLILGISFEQSNISEQQIANSWRQVSLQTTKLSSPNSNSFLSYWKYAAAFAVIVCSTLAIYFISVHQTSTVYETPYGVTQDIVLEDGTKVTLNGNSELIIKRNWLATSSRVVELKGEAFFNVSSYNREGQKIPFMVHTPDLQVKVLGTQFNVNSRRGQTQVVLNEGKVLLEIPEAEEATMRPGELISYTASNSNITRQNVNPEIYSSWRNHILVLDDTPVGHIIQQLEDSYGVEFILSDESIRDRKISSTGNISAGELKTILAAMEALLQIQIERQGNTIKLYGK